MDVVSYILAKQYTNEKIAELDPSASGEQALQEIAEAKQDALSSISTETESSVQEVKDAAQQSLDAASSSATLASESASAAASSASAAQQSRDAASSSATQAGESASAAKDSENAAEASATAAAASESSAESAAGRAEQAAQNSGLPQPTTADAGKVPTVNDAGTGYELGEVQTDAYTKEESDARYAPIAAAIRPTVSGNPATLEHSVAWAMQGLNVYGKSTQVTTTGAQLFDISKATPSWDSYGLHITFEDDYIRVAGTATNVPPNENLSFRLLNTPGIFPTGSAAKVFDLTGIGPNYVSFVLPIHEEDPYITIVFSSSEGTKIDFKFRLMVSLKTPTQWEPYTGGKPSPSPDYPQEIVTAGSDGTIDITVSDGADQSQQLSISTPNGLPGIPVNSGGNLTDADGQQWICDEVDFDAGVYVQRIGKVTSYSGEYVEGHYMSTTGQLTTGATILYALAAPIETPLSAKELAAYAALRTYDGTTVVATDAPVAGLSARYVADGAAYIESKIQAALSPVNQAILEAKTNV